MKSSDFEKKKIICCIIIYFFRNEGAEDALEMILPELTHFCSYVHKYVMMELMDTGDEQEIAVHCMEREFVTNQLVSMTMLYDLADEVILEYNSYLFFLWHQ